MSDSEDELTVISAESARPMKRRLNYSLAFKRQVINFALKFDNSKAAKNYGVPRSCVQGWVKQKDMLEENAEEKGNSKKKRLEGGGRNVQDTEFDSKIEKWVRDQRNEKMRVSRKMIQKQAKIFNLDANFTASNGWLQRFMKRHRLVLRRATTVCQKTPDMYAQKLADFVIFVEKARTKNQYKSIYACDETAVYMDWSNTLTAESKGAQQVPVRNTGHEKLHVTVMLCARDDGYKCKPYVLLPNKRPVKAIVEKYKKHIQLSWAGRTFFNDETTKDFLYSVLGSSLFGKRLLVWDSYRCHISADTKKELKKLSFDTAVIPGGTTKFLQAADVYWNAPFKAKIRQQYEDWMTHGLKTYTKGGNMRAPPMDVYLQWIVDAWRDLPTELIIKSFKGCALSTVPGGEEDHLIHCFKPGSEVPEGLELLQKTRADCSLEELEHLVEEVEITDDYDDYGGDSDDSLIFE